MSTSNRYPDARGPAAGPFAVVGALCVLTVFMGGLVLIGGAVALLSGAAYSGPCIETKTVRDPKVMMYIPDGIVFWTGGIDREVCVRRAGEPGSAR